MSGIRVLVEGTVELVGDGIQTGLAASAQVKMTGKALEDKPFGAIVAATLPGTLRITEVGLDTDERGTFGHFGNLIPVEGAETRPAGS